MTIYKVALIGCGKIASQFANDPKIKGIYTHAGAYTACPKTKLIAVCDTNESYAIECAKKWGVAQCYTNPAHMLISEKPDIVSICTPDETHADILELVLEIPGIKGILIEKPLALDVTRASHLITQTKKKQIALLVNYNRRYAVGHKKIKEFIENGYLGDIKKISGYYTKGILHNGTHWLDLARWLIGEINVVQGFQCKQQGYGQNLDDPTLDAWLKFNNGAVGYLHGLDADAFNLFEIDILGINGRIRIINSGYLIEYFNISESEYFSGYKILQKSYQENDNVTDTLLNVVADLINSIEQGTEPVCSGQDGLLALKIAAELIRSFKIGNKINLCTG